MKKGYICAQINAKKVMNIVILDGYTANPGDLSWKAFEKLGSVTVYDYTGRDKVVERAKDADAVLANKSLLLAEEIAQLPKLKYIGVLATGYNNVDLKAAAEHGIVVTNVPAYSTDSVAQTTIAHILNITNSVADYNRRVHEGEWCRSESPTYLVNPLSDLAGKTLGIVGLGNIGTKVCQIALAFGMDVCALTSKDASALPAGVRKVTKEELFAQSDFLSLHCPLSESTKDIVCATTLAMMKPSAVVVNTSRGPLVNQEDMVKALSSGQIRAYCTDVLTTEPALEDNPLWKLPNAYITSHVAWTSFEARTRLIDVTFRSLDTFAAGRVPETKIN